MIVVHSHCDTLHRIDYSMIRRSSRYLLSCYYLASPWVVQLFQSVRQVMSFMFFFFLNIRSKNQWRLSGDFDKLCVLSLKRLIGNYSTSWMLSVSSKLFQWERNSLPAMWSYLISQRTCFYTELQIIIYIVLFLGEPFQGAFEEHWGHVDQLHSSIFKNTTIALMFLQITICPISK